MTLQLLGAEREGGGGGIRCRQRGHIHPGMDGCKSVDAKWKSKMLDGAHYGLGRETWIRTRRACMTRGGRDPGSEET